MPPIGPTVRARGRKVERFFGNGVLNADLETYFVMDDNEDRQYILTNHFYPDAADKTRGGWECKCTPRDFSGRKCSPKMLSSGFMITNMGQLITQKLFLRSMSIGNRRHRQRLKQRGRLRCYLESLLRLVYPTLGNPELEPHRIAGYAFLEKPRYLRRPHR